MITERHGIQHPLLELWGIKMADNDNSGCFGLTLIIGGIVMGLCGISGWGWLIFTGLLVG